VFSCRTSSHDCPNLGISGTDEDANAIANAKAGHDGDASNANARRDGNESNPNANAGRDGDDSNSNANAGRDGDEPNSNAGYDKYEAGGRHF
jgi:hypothetical protein